MTLRILREQDQKEDCSTKRHQDPMIREKTSALEGRELGAAFPMEEENIEYPEWQEPLRAAILEIDKQKLRERVQLAEAAIFARQQQLAHNSDHTAEQQAIQDALNTLRVIKREVLGFPDWEK